MGAGAGAGAMTAAARLVGVLGTRVALVQLEGLGALTAAAEGELFVFFEKIKWRVNLSNWRRFCLHVFVVVVKKNWLRNSPQGVCHETIMSSSGIITSSDPFITGYGTVVRL